MRMRLVWQAVSMADMRNVYKMLVKREGNKALGRPRLVWEVP
jgi:hypothetical protein